MSETVFMPVYVLLELHHYEESTVLWVGDDLLEAERQYHLSKPNSGTDIELTCWKHGVLTRRREKYEGMRNPDRWLAVS